MAAQAAFEANDFTECLALLDDKPIELSHEEHRLRALCLGRLGRLDEAVEKMDELIGMYPNDESLQNERKVCAEQLSRIRADAANELFKAGEVAAAIAAYSTVNVEDCGESGRFAILNNRGALYLQCNRLEEAIADFDGALKIKADSIDALHNKASALRVLGKSGEALELFDRCLEIDGTFYLCLCGKVECLSSLNRFQEAIATSDIAVQVSPDQPRAYVDRAFALLKSGLSEAAIQDFEAAIGMGDSSAETNKLHSLAVAMEGDKHLAKGEEAAAVECYDKAFSLNSPHTNQNPNVVYNYALAKLRLGQNADAVAGFKKVLSIDANKFEAASAIGILSLQTNDLPTAAEYFAKATELRPEDVDTLYNLGVVRLKENKQDEAMVQFQRVLEMDPNHRSARQAVDALAAANGTKQAVMEQARTQAGKTAPSQTGTSAEEEEVLVLDDEEEDDVLVIEDEEEPSAPARVQPPLNASPTASSVMPPLPGADEEGVVRKSKPKVPQPSVGGITQAMGTMEVSKDATGLPEPEDSGLVFEYARLKSAPYPTGIDVSRRELYLSDDEFQQVFGMSKAEFKAMPNWKRAQKKRDKELF